jgi:hypothetical protein
MKNLILALALIFGVIAFSSCTKENVQPTHKAVKLADKGTLSQADFTGDPDPTIPPADGDKGTLSQADGAGH